MTFLLAGCASTTRVIPVSQVKGPGRGGVVYALPTTALDIEVPFVKTTKTPGKFRVDAEKLFGAPATIVTESTSFAPDVPTVTPRGLVDHQKVFYAEVVGGPFSNSSMTFQFDTQGILTSGIVESENKTVDFVVSTIEAAAKIAGSASFASINDKQINEVKMEPEERAAYNGAQQAMALMNNVVTGTGTSDLPTFQARLAKAQEILDAAMAPFYGTTEKKTWKIQFRVHPQDSGNSTLGLFDYSKEKGITAFNFKPRNSTQEGFITKEKVAAAKVVALHISTKGLVDRTLAVNTLFSQPERGIHYNLPATGTVSISDGESRLLTIGQSFGQFGAVGFLPVTTGSEKLHQEVTLDGTTGALVKVQDVSNAFDPQLINRTGTAVSGALDAAKPAKK